MEVYIIAVGSCGSLDGMSHRWVGGHHITKKGFDRRDAREYVYQACLPQIAPISVSMGTSIRVPSSTPLSPGQIFTTGGTPLPTAESRAGLQPIRVYAGHYPTPKTSQARARALAYLYLAQARATVLLTGVPRAGVCNVAKVKSNPSRRETPVCPYKPLHPCNHHGCPALTLERFCPTHQRQVTAEYEASRGTAAERGYDGTWAKVRVWKLSHEPLCERCQAAGRDVAAVLVHHCDRNPRHNESSNLESLCDPCHDQEHVKEAWGGRSKSLWGERK